MRAFLALPLPEALIATAALAQARLRLDNPVPRENLHVTIAFLGDVNARPTLEDFHAALSASSLPAPTLQATGLGTFGSERQRSLHMALAPDPGLDALHRAAQRAARQAGIALQARRFQPHVTLAYLRGAPDAALARLIEEAGAITAPPTLADTLTLYESRLTKAGAVYTALADYPLNL